eukprot:TRINITY_DN93855_c0_g1_i1.p1 TRINITY_DN93855_c0_g1~~TRINITY_DN93855_c0_g1_i1.p1  ORF type:complete len:106 (-),score=13.63 TRINITY_DN93855_c0_g1_i1:10-294(-)
MSNVAVNVGSSILMADLTSGLIGFFVSTFALVIFGEILPQALCQRHRLFIGAKAAPSMWILMIFMAPICWPIAKEIGRAVQQECRDRSRMPSSA